MRMLHTKPAVALLGALFALGVAALARGETAPGPYRSLAIGAPADGATVFDNGGNVEVSVSISPALRAGDRVVLALDGRAVRERSGARFALSRVDRGEHTLRARVIDAGGNTLISSAPATFYLWRASRLFPNRRRG